MSHLAELDDLVARKRIEVARKREEWPVSKLMQRVRSRPPPLALTPVLAEPGIAVIAEIKNRSFRGDNYASAADPGRVARVFAANGAAAIAVLADALRFGGSSELVEEVVAGAGRAVPVIYRISSSVHIRSLRHARSALIACWR